MAISPHVEMIRLANSMGDAVSNEIGTLTAKKEDVAKGALMVLFRLQKMYEDKPEILQALPRVGTHQKDGDNNPEYKYEDVLTANGGTRKVETSGIAALWHNMPGAKGGKALKATLADVNAALTPKKGGIIKPQYTELGESDLLRMRNRLRSAVNNGLTLLRNAIALQHTIWDIQGMAHVGLEFATETDAETGEVRPAATEPFTVYSKKDGERSKMRPVSVPTMLRFDVKAAVDKGGSYSDLINTLSREGDNEKSKVKPFENFDTYNAVTAERCAWLEQEKNLASIKRAFVGGPEYDAFIVSEVEAFDALDGIVNTPKARDRYAEAIERIAKAMGEKPKAEQKVA